MKRSTLDFTITLQSSVTEWSTTLHFGGDELAAEAFGNAAMAIVPPVKIVGGYTDSAGRSFFPDFHWNFSEHNQEIMISEYAKKVWRERNPSRNPDSLLWGELSDIQRWTFTDSVRGLYLAQFEESGE